MNPSHEEPHRIFFETLSNKVRWDVVHLLRKGNCRSTDIAQQLGYEQSLVSHHLKRLEKCGFVSATTDGKERTYELNHKTIKPLLAIVEEHTNKFCKKLCSKCRT